MDLRSLTPAKAQSMVRFCRAAVAFSDSVSPALQSSTLGVHYIAKHGATGISWSALQLQDVVTQPLQH